MYICILKFVFKGISICHPTSFLYILFLTFWGYLEHMVVWVI